MTKNEARNATCSRRQASRNPAAAGGTDGLTSAKHVQRPKQAARFSHIFPTLLPMRSPCQYNTKRVLSAT
jgi:hypothetical protein